MENKKIEGAEILLGLSYTLNGDVEEMLGGYNVIKAFTAEDKMLDKFSSDNELLYNDTR